MEPTNIIRDTYHEKIKHNNILFQLLKTSKNDQFIDYLAHLDKSDSDLNAKDEQGNYLIFLAILTNNKKIVRELINNDVRLDLIDTDGYSILYYPIKYNYPDILEILLKKDIINIGTPIREIWDIRGDTPLIYSIKFNNSYALQELLNTKIDVSHVNKKGLTALHIAVLKKQKFFVRIIANYMNNINIKSITGDTALHYACSYQLKDIISILIEKGADVNIAEYEHGFYPIFYTVIQHDIQNIKPIIEAGYDINNQDNAGNTVLHYAIIYEYDAIIDLLFNFYKVKYEVQKEIYSENISETHTIDQIKKLKKKLFNKNPPLREITENHEDQKLNKNEIDYYKILKKKIMYIDPKLVNLDGLTILHLMLYNYKEQYIPYIKRLIKDSDIDYQDNLGNTPMHIMVSRSIWSIFIDELSQKNINIFINNRDNKNVFGMIHLKDQGIFLEMISSGFYENLVKKSGVWKIHWQNMCSSKKISEKECKNEIKKFIFDTQTSVPVKKNKIVLSIDYGENVKFTTFTGSLLDMICGFRYIELKYPSITSTMHDVPIISPENEFNKYAKTLGMSVDLDLDFPNFEIKWAFQQIFFPENFNKVITNFILSKQKTYIVIPIGIILSNGNHSNVLIFDLNKMIIERFEPHGSGYPYQFNYNPILLDETILSKILEITSNIYDEKKLSVNFSYMPPSQYLPKIGLQTFDNAEVHINKNIGDPNGFCTLWCIWYVDQRLKHNQIPLNKLIVKIIREIRKNNNPFRNIIRNYSANITNFRDNILQSVGADINDYINNRINHSNKKIIINNILEKKSI